MQIGLLWRVCMGVQGRLTAKNGGFRPGRAVIRKPLGLNIIPFCFVYRYAPYKVRAALRVVNCGLVPV